MRSFATAAAALALAACGQQTSSTTTPEPPPATTPAPAPANTNAITSEGWGPLRIGMTRAEVIAALGPDANPNAVGGPDQEACDLFHPANAPEGLYVMIQRTCSRASRCKTTRR